MKKIILIFLLATNICLAQKKIAIVITGYDNTRDNWEICNVNFADTSYYQIDQKAISVFEKDSIYYNLYSEINPWDKSEYEVCDFHYYTDRWGSDCWLNVYDVIFYIARKKLISLGKL